MPDGIQRAPSTADIATRIDMGDAAYHDTCCPVTIYMADESIFSGVPACACGGPEMARAYVELRGLVEKILADFGPDSDLGYLAKEALET